MDVFARLGAFIEQRWDAVSRDEGRFAELAEQALTEALPELDLTLPELAEWALFGPALPPQASRRFGQPPLNLYVGSGFYIEANIWLDGTTTIHQHSFAGAFCMLVGRSLHGRYAFHEEERINAQLRLGRCTFLSAELLGPGQVRRIDAGSRLIHSAFHLDRPSVSIVVRTESDPEAGPQLDYLPPFVAVDPRPDREPLRTQLDLLDTLAVIEPARYLAALERLVGSENRFLVYRVLARAMPRIGQGADWDRIEAAARKRHPDFVPRICESLREAARQEALVAHRGSLHREDDRLLLALLIALPSRAAIHEILESIDGSMDSSKEYIAKALEQLTEQAEATSGAES